MSHVVWRFEYNVKERIEALRDILVQNDRLLPSQVRREWLYHAQLVLEPADWNALWRIPKENCKYYGVRFPCVVYVIVEGLELNDEELAVRVEVLGVQDDSIHLPEKPLVPIEQLWPTLAQSNTAIEMKSTAKFIDLYRYFYNFIWMPWDLEEEEQTNSHCWFDLHVPPRCNLWAAAFAGQGCPSHKLYTLRNDAEIVRKNIIRIEESLSSDSEDNLDTNSNNMSILVSLHEQLNSIRARWELLQNPILKELWNDTTNQILPVQTEVVIVWAGGILKDYTNCLEAADKWLKLRDMDSNTQVGCSPSLSMLFNSKMKNPPIILLCEGIHLTLQNFSIGNECMIASASLKSKSVLKCLETCSSAISVSANVEFNNVFVESQYCTTGIAIRDGRLRLNSCSIQSPTDAQAQAIIVFEKGELVCNSCTIQDFYTGIVAHKGSKIELVDCVFDSCGVMLQIYEGAQVSLLRCSFKNYTDTAIRYDTCETSNTSMGGVELLQKFKNIKIKDCKFLNSKKNDICISRLDEFACPQLEDNIAHL